MHKVQSREGNTSTPMVNLPRADVRPMATRDDRLGNGPTQGIPALLPQKRPLQSTHRGGPPIRPTNNNATRTGPSKGNTQQRNATRNNATKIGPLKGHTTTPIPQRPQRMDHQKGQKSTQQGLDPHRAIYLQLYHIYHNRHHDNTATT